MVCSRVSAALRKEKSGIPKRLSGLVRPGAGAAVGDSQSVLDFNEWTNAGCFEVGRSWQI